jgi:multicomponent Na+:H+ antiporter subunit E
LLVGFVLGYLILGFALRDVPDFARYRKKVPRLFLLLGHFLRDLVASNLRVAYDVLTPTHYMRPAVVALPLRAKTDGAITILANMISLTPGTLSLDVSSDRSVLYLHVMYLDDEEDLRQQIHALEDRVLALLE